jgi:hypothetical protein
MDYGENPWIWIIHELEVTDRRAKEYLIIPTAGNTIGPSAKKKHRTCLRN